MATPLHSGHTIAQWPHHCTVSIIVLCHFPLCATFPAKIMAMVEVVMVVVVMVVAMVAVAMVVVAMVAVAMVVVMVVIAVMW